MSRPCLSSNYFQQRGFERDLNILSTKWATEPKIELANPRESMHSISCVDAMYSVFDFFLRLHWVTYYCSAELAALETKCFQSSFKNQRVTD